MEGQLEIWDFSNKKTKCQLALVYGTPVHRLLHPPIAVTGLVSVSAFTIGVIHVLVSACSTQLLTLVPDG